MYRARFFPVAPCMSRIEGRGRPEDAGEARSGERGSRDDQCGGEDAGASVHGSPPRNLQTRDATGVPAIQAHRSMKQAPGKYAAK